MVERTNRIAEVRKARGMTQQQLGDAVGAHWITISKLERGVMQLTFDWAERLAKPLSVSPIDLFAKAEVERTVFVEGAVGDRGHVLFYANEKGQAESEAILVEFGPQETGESFWLSVETDELFPIVHNGDMIRLTYVRQKEQYNTFIGRLCMAFTTEPDQALLGILARGSREGLYELRTIGGAPRQEVKIELLAYVSMGLFYPPRRDQKTLTEILGYTRKDS